MRYGTHLHRLDRWMEGWLFFSLNMKPLNLWVADEGVIVMWLGSNLILGFVQHKSFHSLWSYTQMGLTIEPYIKFWRWLWENCSHQNKASCVCIAPIISCFVFKPRQRTFQKLSSWVANNYVIFLPIANTTFLYSRTFIFIYEVFFHASCVFDTQDPHSCHKIFHSFRDVFIYE